MENYIFFLVEGQPLFNTASQICLQNIEDHSIHFVNMSDEIYEILKKDFPNMKLPSSIPENEVTVPTPSTSGEKHWSRAATLYLIELRKKYEQKFKSTTIKNEQVWQMVSQEMRTGGFYYNNAQCRDKWQYLKKRYMKKRDNTGPRATGEGRIHCDFFDELHEILGKKHNVTPQAIASSLKGVTGGTLSDTSDGSILEDKEQDERPLKKAKKNIKKNDVVIKFMEDLQASNIKKEANRERRHQELVECRNRATDTFAEKMDKLINTLNK